jgi:hypothetical protein
MIDTIYTASYMNPIKKVHETFLMSQDLPSFLTRLITHVRYKWDMEFFAQETDAIRNLEARSYTIIEFPHDGYIVISRQS